ncbi:hypothetical protein PICMEDRAFT_72273, partial [Pichia membranifaciens NRRL Y-2026]
PLLGVTRYLASGHNCPQLSTIVHNCQQQNLPHPLELSSIHSNYTSCKYRDCLNFLFSIKTHPTA